MNAVVTGSGAENIVTEMHEAVSQLGVEEYALMGHSIGGLYGLPWAERFGAMN